MDTDDLTDQAYAMLPRAHAVLDVLRLEIGASAMQYSSEDDLLRGTLRRLRSILNDPDSYLDFWNYLDTVDPKQFAEGVRGLIGQVEKTLNTPRHQRLKNAG